MGWAVSLVDRLNELSKNNSIECPRGWGDVTFDFSLSWFFFVPIVRRRCPISGEAYCDDCRYARNPDAFLLREQLEELARLEQDGLISRSELDERRAEMLRLFRISRHDLRVAALILGPLAVVFTLAGGALGFGYHAGFLVFAIVGLIGLRRDNELGGDCLSSATDR